MSWSCCRRAGSSLAGSCCLRDVRVVETSLNIRTYAWRDVSSAARVMLCEVPYRRLSRYDSIVGEQSEDASRTAATREREEERGRTNDTGAQRGEERKRINVSIEVRKQVVACPSY